MKIKNKIWIFCCLLIVVGVLFVVIRQNFKQYELLNDPNKEILWLAYDGNEDEYWLIRGEYGDGPNHRIKDISPFKNVIKFCLKDYDSMEKDSYLKNKKIELFSVSQHDNLILFNFMFEGVSDAAIIYVYDTVKEKIFRKFYFSFA